MMMMMMMMMKKKKKKKKKNKNKNKMNLKSNMKVPYLHPEVEHSDVKGFDLTTAGFQVFFIFQVHQLVKLLSTWEAKIGGRIGSLLEFGPSSHCAASARHWDVE